MMPASNQGVGMNMGFPDVCTTPMAPAPVPIPYPNIGMNAMAMPFVPNVLVSLAPAQNMAAKPLLTNGDNAGVAHPLFMQPGGTTMGNPMILMGGMPAAHLCVPTYGNNFNNPIGSKIVPSVTNVLLGCRNAVDAERLRSGAGSTARFDGGVEVLRLPWISLASDAHVANHLERRRHTGVRRMLLDLRSNPGGSVAAARGAAHAILASGIPTAVLVDGRTASAAELLTAELRTHGAEVYGEATFGKHRARPHTVHSRSLAATGAAATMRTARGESLRAGGVRPTGDLHGLRAWLQAR